MDKRTLTALQESIEHWYRISDTETIFDLEMEGYRSGSCPLCKAFASFTLEDDCKGCPVFKATAHEYCIDTPYYPAEASLDKWRATNNWTESDQSNVEAEIRFLESLLP